MKLNAVERCEGFENQDVVVFLHGLFGRARNLGTLQRAMAKTARTIALDLRNHGDSPHGPVSYAAMADDVTKTLSERGIERYALVGHSMGGKVAMHLALTAPEKVTRILIADVAPTITRQGHAALVDRLKTFPFPSSMDRKDALALLMPLVKENAIAHLMVQNMRLGDNPGWRIGFDAIHAGIQTIEGWASPPATPFAGPALFVRGSLSPYVRAEHHAEIQALFPEARIETMDGAGHWLHVEQPEAFSSILNSFLTAPS